MGRDTTGVRGMTVPDGTAVLGMEIASPDDELLVITSKGYGKRTNICEYPLHHRGAQGVLTITMTPKKGNLVAMKVVKSDDEIMVTTQEGVIVRTAVKGISKLGRPAQGVHIMDVADKDTVTAIAIATDRRDSSKEVETEEFDEDDVLAAEPVDIKVDDFEDEIEEE